MFYFLKKTLASRKLEHKVQRILICSIHFLFPWSLLLPCIYIVQLLYLWISVTTLSLPIGHILVRITCSCYPVLCFAKCSMRLCQNHSLIHNSFTSPAGTWPTHCIIFSLYYLLLAESASHACIFLMLTFSQWQYVLKIDSFVSFLGLIESCYVAQASIKLLSFSSAGINTWLTFILPLNSILYMNALQFIYLFISKEHHFL